MSHSKAVVLEKNNNKITVLTHEGAFETLKYKGEVEVGEEILLPAKTRVPIWRIGVSVAAIFLLTFMGIFGWDVFQPRTAVATISLDINPSLQLTVDQKGEVLELESLNSEAEQLVADLSFKGKAWEEAFHEIIQKSVELNYLTEEENWVVVGYSAAKPEKEVPAETINPVEITKKVQEAVNEQGLKPTVAVYELSTEQKQQAKEKGLSLGEYALADTAQKAGVQIEPETLKQKDEMKRILKNPAVQEQLLKEKRIIESTNFQEESSKSQGNFTSLKNKNTKNKNDKDTKGDRKNTQGLRDKDDTRNAKGLGQGNSRDRDNKKDIKEKGKDTEKGENQKGNQNKKNNKSGDQKDNNSKSLKFNNERNDQGTGSGNKKQNDNSQKDKYSELNWNFRTILRLSFSQRA